MRESIVQVFYSDIFELPLPAGHRFPMSKYRLLHERVREQSARLGIQLQSADPATLDELRAAHCDPYLSRAIAGQLSPLEVRRIGFPWSEKLIERSRRSTGATLAAARAALLEQRAVNLAGGTHHAFEDRGQGYCVFNDVAVAIKSLQLEGIIQEALVIDTDVHQGNGTAAIFADDPRVFTFSIHGERNRPYGPCASDLDIGLPDGTGDEEYLDHLRIALNDRLPRRGPQLCVYVAGADPFVDDRLGRLALTKGGLRERDMMVVEFAHRQRMPLVITMAGGYSPSVNDIVDIHFQTVEIAANACEKRGERV